MNGMNHVGVVAIRNCCEYWGNLPSNKDNRAVIVQSLIGIVSKIIFISRGGKTKIVSVPDLQGNSAVKETEVEKDKRLLVILKVQGNILQESSILA